MSNTIRPWTENDIPEIDRIWKEFWSDQFSVPDRRNSLTDSVVVDENDRIIAYGQLKLFAEAMFICDKSRSRRELCEALLLLMAQAFKGLNRVQIHEMYCFIKDPDFALLIEKHFKFHPVLDPGQLLLWVD